MVTFKGTYWVCKNNKGRTDKLLPQFYCSFEMEAKSALDPSILNLNTHIRTEDLPLFH